MGGRALADLDLHERVQLSREPVSGRAAPSPTGTTTRASSATPAAEKSSLDNEQIIGRRWTRRGARCSIRQIAGLVARRIVTDHEVGTEVQQGERMGMIRFGSRVDLFLPAGTRVAGAGRRQDPRGRHGGGRMELMQRQRSACAGRTMRQVVVVMPSAFTLGNLFFGFWAIVSAFNGNFRWAGWFIVFAGILDMLDGRVARLSGTGTRFGAELDSLVDVISFGVAPALLIYFLDFSSAGRFAWILCYIYVVAVALRLARFNVLSAGKPSTGWFTGIPSPSAGMTLAVYYPFSQTEWYRASLAYLDLQHQGLVVLMLLLAVLMVSNVKYPKFPPIGVRSARGNLRARRASRAFCSAESSRLSIFCFRSDSSTWPSASPAPRCWADGAPRAGAGRGGAGRRRHACPSCPPSRTSAGAPGATADRSQKT